MYINGACASSGFRNTAMKGIKERTFKTMTASSIDVLCSAVATPWAN